MTRIGLPLCLGVAVAVGLAFGVRPRIRPRARRMVLRSAARVLARYDLLYLRLRDAATWLIALIAAHGGRAGAGSLRPQRPLTIPAVRWC